MNALKATEIQLSKPRITPNNQSGDMLKVGVKGVTEIAILGSVAIISYVRDGKQKRFVVRDYLYALLADEVQPEPEAKDGALSCDICGENFKASQGLAGHKLHKHGVVAA